MFLSIRLSLDSRIQYDPEETYLLGTTNLRPLSDAAKGLAYTITIVMSLLMLWSVCCVCCKSHYFLLAITCLVDFLFKIALLSLMGVNGNLKSIIDLFILLIHAGI